MTLIFWNKLFQYHDEPKPRFSIDWLNNFKACYKIKKYTKHDEIDAIDRIIIEKKLLKLRRDFEIYDMKNIYNMNEINLYWKQTLDETFSIK